jgi:hypothetical protein
MDEQSCASGVRGVSAVAGGNCAVAVHGVHRAQGAVEPTLAGFIIESLRREFLMFTTFTFYRMIATNL